MGIATIPAPSGAKSQYFQEFASGTTSWTAPTGVTTIECLLVAGGGAGVGWASAGSVSNGGGTLSTAGTSNTGGGGGGSGANPGYAGGSGIVIVRYLKSAV